MSTIFRTLLSRGSLSTRLVGCSRNNFSSTSCVREKPVVATETVPKIEKNPLNILHEGKFHKVDNLEKRFLVWSGKYKRVEDVPATVSQEAMEKARNKARIRITNYMMLATVVACIIFVYSGKQAAKRGESVQKMNLDWHEAVKNSEVATK